MPLPIESRHALDCSQKPEVEAFEFSLPYGQIGSECLVAGCGWSHGVPACRRHQHVPDFTFSCVSLCVKDQYRLGRARRRSLYKGNSELLRKRQTPCLLVVKVVLSC